MSKTFDNAINLSDSAEDVFAKTMRLPDALLLKFFELATGLTGREVGQIRDALAAGENPMQLKLRLGRQLALELHGEAAAGRVHDEWVSVHCRGAAPTDMPSHAVTAGASLVSILVSAGIATSNSKARELIRAGAVSLDGTKVQDQTFTLSVPAGSSIIVKAGKRHFVRLTHA